MIILEDVLSQEIIQKLGWTLVHFIWQAAVAALLLATLLKLLRKSTPSLRYIIACLALGLIVLLPVITIQLVPVLAPHSAANIEPAPAPAVLSIEEMPPAETTIVEEPEQLESVAPISADSWKQRTIETLEPALPYIVSGWLVGVFGLSIWHLGGWAQLQRLRRRMVRQVNDTLYSKLKVLAERLRVKQTVQLMESALVQIPAVVGWLRPVILLPASALTGLSTEQLEAILAHELAHIKRYDYLINILQTVVEILGFYHPAVWWVSHKIRAERENCCDDLAVSISGDRVCYARALTSMEEIRTSQGGLAVAATGGNLFKRIYRLVGKDSAQKTNFSWIPAATAILLIIALVIPTTLAFTTKSDSQQPDSKIDVHVENDRSGESQQGKESLANNIPTVLPTIVKSPTPSAQDKTIIQVDCLVVEVFTDLKMDRETTIMAENLLGNKISLRDTKVDVLLRKAAGATAATKDKSAENKRVTEQEFNALVDMLTSRGYMKILMNPVLEVINGKTARISSSQHVPLQVITKTIPGAAGLTTIVSTETEYIDVVDSLEITPHVFADGHIILQVEAAISSKSIPKGIEQIPIVSTREISTRVHTSPGESLIIGGLKETGKSSETDRNVKGPKEKSKEVLFIILTPTIISPSTDSQEKADTQIEVKKVLSAQKLKRLGLAVAMYADDHDDNLPDSLQKLKLYIRDEQDFNWLLDNIEYIGEGKTAQRHAGQIPIAYDKAFFIETDTTNVLFLDFSVRFLDAKEVEKLDIKRTKILIETWFLSVSEDFLQNIGRDASSPDEAKALLRLRSELLAASDGSKTKSLILDDSKAKLLLGAVQAHKDSRVLAAPQVLCLEGKTAEISVVKVIPFITGYSEPNQPSGTPEPKVDEVEEGIALSVKPRLTPNKNIDLVFELEITQVLGFEERMYKGKYPYKHLTVQRIAQSARYRAHNGQTLLSWGHKKTEQQDGRTEKKDLLFLIKAETAGSSEENKSAQTGDLAAAVSGKTASDVIMQPGIVQSRIVRPYENKQESNIQVEDKSKEPVEIEKRVESAKKLSNLGHALFIYANDHEDKYPDSLHELRGYLKTEDFAWTRQNVEYLAHGKTVSVRPDTVIAYDKKLLAERKGTNVLFNDSHVEFVQLERLKELGISATAILIDTRLLSVSEDFLKNIGLDANSVSNSDAWSEHLVADSAAEPNSETYSLILDELQIRFLLRAVQAHQGSKMLAAPQVLCQEGKTASIGILTESYYVMGYTEPNRPSDEPEPKKDKVEIGARIWLKPELTPDNQNIKLDFKMEIRQLLGFEERAYKGKYIYLKPRIEVVSTKMPCLIPDGKTLLIGGLKIIKQVESRSSAPILSKLPVVGELFRSRDKIKEQKILLILVKPIINPQQKASKILPGQADSEEHIKSLARLLEKKLNSPAGPK